MSSLVDGMDNLAVATAVVVDGAAPTGTIAGSADLRTCGGTLLVEVLQGKDLVAKDRGFMRSGKSDPFCKVTVGGRPVGNGKTKVVPKTLNPTWNWTGLRGAEPVASTRVEESYVVGRRVINRRHHLH